MCIFSKKPVQNVSCSRQNLTPIFFALFFDFFSIFLAFFYKFWTRFPRNFPFGPVSKKNHVFFHFFCCFFRKKHEKNVKKTRFFGFTRFSRKTHFFDHFLKTNFEKNPLRSRPSTRKQHFLKTFLLKMTPQNSEILSLLGIYIYRMYPRPTWRGKSDGNLMKSWRKFRTWSMHGNEHLSRPWPREIWSVWPWSNRPCRFGPCPNRPRSISST